MVKTGHSHFLTANHYYKFSEKMKMLVLFPLLLIFLSNSGSQDLFHLIIKSQIHYQHSVEIFSEKMDHASITDVS